MIDDTKLPTLTSARVALRWLEESDCPALFEVFSDPEVMRYWSSPPWPNMERAAEMVKNVHQLFADHSLYQWGVARVEDNKVIGTCTLAGLDSQNRRAEIGFALRRDQWKKGIMTEAITTLLRFSFAQLNLHRIEADVDPRNSGSLRMLERLGFQKEGFLRERWLVNGEINDTVFYGLLQREWLDPDG